MIPDCVKVPLFEVKRHFQYQFLPCGSPINGTMTSSAALRGTLGMAEQIFVNVSDN